jgi:hypothetical protein
MENHPKDSTTSRVFIFAKLLDTIPQSCNRNTCTFALEFCQGENLQKKNDKNPSSGACRKKYEVFL